MHAFCLDEVIFCYCELVIYLYMVAMQVYCMLLHVSLFKYRKWQIFIDFELANWDFETLDL
jgi:hypothetical protein